MTFAIYFPEKEQWTIPTLANWTDGLSGGRIVHNNNDDGQEENNSRSWAEQCATGLKGIQQPVLLHMSQMCSLIVRHATPTSFWLRDVCYIRSVIYDQFFFEKHPVGEDLKIAEKEIISPRITTPAELLFVLKRLELNLSHTADKCFAAEIREALENAISALCGCSFFPRQTQSPAPSPSIMPSVPNFILPPSPNLASQRRRNTDLLSIPGGVVLPCSTSKTEIPTSKENQGSQWWKKGRAVAYVPQWMDLEYVVLWLPSNIFSMPSPVPPTSMPKSGKKTGSLSGAKVLPPPRTLYGEISVPQSRLADACRKVALAPWNAAGVLLSRGPPFGETNAFAPCFTMHGILDGTTLASTVESCLRSVRGVSPSTVPSTTTFSELAVVMLQSTARLLYDCDHSDSLLKMEPLNVLRPLAVDVPVDNEESLNDKSEDDWWVPKTPPHPTNAVMMNFRDVCPVHHRIDDLHFDLNDVVSLTEESTVRSGPVHVLKPQPIRVYSSAANIDTGSPTNFSGSRYNRKQSTHQTKKRPR